MKTIELSGYKRKLTTKSGLRTLRKEGWVPCELYGKDFNLHFLAFVSDFKPIIYTPEVYKVQLNIEGETFLAVLKEKQFHPLNDMLMHADFYVIPDDKRIKIELPLRFNGVAAGAREGGKFVKKLRTIKVRAFAKDLPEAIELDITSLGLGKSVKVRDLKADKVEILNSPSIPIATVEVPRSMRGKQAEETTGKK